MKEMDTFGTIFKMTVFGESHSPKLGVSLKGVPSGLLLDVNDFVDDLARRKSGMKGTTSRNEEDIPQITSGLAAGVTTGEVLTIEFVNENIRPHDYFPFKDIPRPGHADFVSRVKYGSKYNRSGGGQFSGRMTLPLVAAGVVAKKIIDPIGISARVIMAGGVQLGDNPFNSADFNEILDNTIKDGDSIGGVVECVCRNVPVGLGEPFFNSMESLISHLVFSIPGVKGIEFGAGFAASAMKGSELNDSIIDSNGGTATNHSGGINGGISNGNPIVFRVAFKPASSIAKPQRSYNFSTREIEEFSIVGRHDACFALRVPVVVESVTACAICDCLCH